MCMKRVEYQAALTEKIAQMVLPHKCNQGTSTSIITRGGVMCAMCGHPSVETKEVPKVKTLREKIQDCYEYTIESI